jgi:type I restriction enzyme S subunit
MKAASKPAQVPKLRFSGFEGEWCCDANTGSLCELIVDCVNKTAPVVEEETPFKMLRTTNVRNGKIDLSYCRRVTQETFETWTRRAKVERGDVILTREAPIGEVGYVDFDDTVFLGQRLMQYRVNSCKLDPLYLLCAFLSPSLRGQFAAHDGTGSTVSHIRVGDCSKFIVAHPTLPEQQKIAAFLTAVDGRIEQLSRKKALLEATKKGVMQQLFTQTLRFQDDHGHDFPDWEEKPLSEVVTINPKARELPDSFTYIDLESVDAGVLHSPKQIDKADAPSRAQRLLQTKDILYQTVRPYQMNNLFFDLEGAYVASTGYAQLRATKHNPRYIYHALHVKAFVNAVMDRCTGTSFPAINSKDLGDITIPVPSLPEQTKIAGFLSALDGKIGAVGEQMRQTQAWKKGLLQRMFV